MKKILAILCLALLLGCSSGLSIDGHIEKLEKLGIQVSDSLETSIDPKTVEINGTVYQDMIYMYILIQSGIGEYDEEKFAYVPTNETVYVFDAEAINIDNMYANLCDGLSSITKDDFVIENVKQEVIEESEDGIGMYQIEFTINGNVYTAEAEMRYDWIDTNFMSYVNEAIEKEGYDNRLYYTWYTQEVVVLYRDRDWVDEFEALTEIELY